jgi:hypothetical protein
MSALKELQRYDASSKASEHGCFVIYEDHMKAIRDAYTKGVEDAHKNCEKLLERQRAGDER